jgi:hypothetical protein
MYEGRTEIDSQIHSRIINLHEKQMEVDLEGDGKTDPWISTGGYEFINPKNSTSSTR